MQSHTDRLAAIVSRFEEAMTRFREKLANADAASIERAPEDGGWSAAQVAWHVAAVNGSFAKILDGSFPVAKPAAPDFAERDWETIGTGVPEKAQAPSRVQPPGPVTRDEAVAKLDESKARLIEAVRALQADRAVMTLEAPYVGCLSLYQVGEWAAVHVIRHNRQVKRLLSGL
jgi:hypothetical protein